MTRRSPSVLAAALLIAACTSSGETAPTTTATEAATVTSESTTSAVPTSPTTTAPPTTEPTTASVLPPDPDETARTLGIEVEAVLPHDDAAVTTGLDFVDDRLLESTGLYGRSSRRLLDPSTGDLLQEVTIQPELYTQGITTGDDFGWQMSWQEQLAIVFETDSLVERRRVTFEGEGWGICELGGSVYTTAANSVITERDPNNFAVLSELEVTLGGEAVTNLTELECADDQLWAIVWPSSTVVAVDPTTGAIDAVVDADRLVPAGVGAEDVLSAIAYREPTDTWFVTGRRWDVLYEVSVVEP